MKKVIASASMFAVGAAGLQGANAPGLTRMETSKPWTISGSIRAFYDDNYNIRPSDHDAHRDSFGFEFAPKVAFHIPKDQTYVGGSYEYSMKYYEDRDDDEIDQTHTVRLDLNHRFSSRHMIRGSELFVYSDEPELQEPGGGAPLRTDASGIRNVVRVDYNAVLTERLGAAAGYQNNFYSYDDDGPGSRSALLDRLEHLFNIDGRWQYTETIVALVGYQLGVVNYTADEIIQMFPTTLMSDDRDNISHYLYVGADGQVTEKLSTTAKVGAQYIDFDSSDGDSEVSPYAEISATYTYLPNSYVQAGLRHYRNATDVPGASDQESTLLYGSVSHRITPRLTGNLYGSFQNSEFQNGQVDGDLDQFFRVAAGLDYEINKHLFAEARYSFDRLDSDRPDRSFTRNRVSVGLRAVY